jgi:hypothetical protein
VTRALLASLLLIAGLSSACAPAAPPPPAPPPPAVPEPEPAAPDYLLREIPVPGAVQRAVEARTRTDTGEPGPAYWQQEVAYTIDVELDPAASVLRGESRIQYRNNSPDVLEEVVVHLHQNVFAPGVPRNRHVAVTGGVELARVAAGGRELASRAPAQLRAGEPGFAVVGTLMEMRLPEPIPPGGSASFELAWEYEVPPAGTFRTAWEDALGGRAFQVAQWYPQIAVYDDLRGWNRAPYLGDGEFYLEYGSFDVAITLPAGWLVGATGTLENPGEVLTPEARERLAAALGTDAVTRVVTEYDLDGGSATLPSQDGQLTWRFRARDVRDFAFVASDRYVWDATRAIVPDGAGGSRAVPVHALYRPGAPGWEEAARYTQHSLEYLSERAIPYLYPQITTGEGPVFGMEYPMVSFIGKSVDPVALYGVIAHEVAHQWFPMMVGTDEARYAWLDEGIASHWDAIATEAFFPEVDIIGGYIRSYLSLAGTEQEAPMMRHTDLVTPYGSRGVAAYHKPALMHRMLRRELGEDGYWEGMNTLAEEWLLKRPTPWDFFNTFERVSGRDLGWLFHPWTFETAVIDRQIVSVDGAETGDLRVTLRDRGGKPAPATLVAVTAAGERVEKEVGVERWLAEGRTLVLMVEAPGPVAEVLLDPERIYPDITPENNVWRAGD